MINPLHSDICNNISSRCAMYVVHLSVGLFVWGLFICIQLCKWFSCSRLAWPWREAWQRPSLWATIHVNVWQWPNSRWSTSTAPCSPSMRSARWGEHVKTSKLHLRPPTRLLKGIVYSKPKILSIIAHMLFQTSETFLHLHKTNEYILDDIQEKSRKYQKHPQNRPYVVQSEYYQANYYQKRILLLIS